MCVMGMVMIIEGLPYFAFPDRIKSWLEKVSEFSEKTLRGFGFALMLFGLVLIYFGKE